MKNELLELIAKASAERLVELIGESSDEIMLACHAAAEQAAEDESETVKVRLSHTILLDLGKSRVTDTLAWSVRHKVEAGGPMPDPDQPELELEP